MDTYADDLSQLIEELDLKGAVLIGFSARGGEVTAILAVMAQNVWQKSH